MQNSIAQALTEYAPSLNVQPWGQQGVTFTHPFSDDPVYATVRPSTGAVVAWYGRGYVDEWSDSCEDTPHPTEALLLDSLEYLSFSSPEGFAHFVALMALKGHYTP